MTLAKHIHIIGIAGSVAVGKSTAARILQALLSRWPDHPKVDLITTDGFLLPNRILEQPAVVRISIPLLLIHHTQQRFTHGEAAHIFAQQPPLPFPRSL